MANWIACPQTVRPRIALSVFLASPPLRQLAACVMARREFFEVHDGIADQEIQTARELA